MVRIVDYGLGNLQSIKNKIERLGFACEITRDSSALLSAERLILPGVGHFREGMKNILNHSLDSILHDAVFAKRIPLLGICLGMQLMTEYSEEGDSAGLGWIKGHCKKLQFSESENLRVPHVGWNRIKKTTDNYLFKEIAETKRFYFTHSYYVTCQDRKNSPALFQ